MSTEEVVLKSRVITDKLLSLPEYRKADRIFTYVDCNNEVITRDLITKAWEAGKHIAVPRCRNKRMDFYEIRDFKELSPGKFGIPEPVTEVRADWEDALMIMPGVAFDRSLHRIGYGGGYYDRYLSLHRTLFCIALAYDLQLFTSLPFDEHDILPDLLITELEVLKISHKA